MRTTGTGVVVVVVVGSVGGGGRTLPRTRETDLWVVTSSCSWGLGRLPPKKRTEDRVVLGSSSGWGRMISDEVIRTLGRNRLVAGVVGLGRRAGCRTREVTGSSAGGVVVTGAAVVDDRNLSRLGGNVGGSSTRTGSRLGFPSWTGGMRRGTCCSALVAGVSLFNGRRILLLRDWRGSSSPSTWSWAGRGVVDGSTTDGDSGWIGGGVNGRTRWKTVVSPPAGCSGKDSWAGRRTSDCCGRNTIGTGSGDTSWAAGLLLDWTRLNWSMGFTWSWLNWNSKSGFCFVVCWLSGRNAVEAGVRDDKTEDPEGKALGNSTIGVGNCGLNPLSKLGCLCWGDARLFNGLIPPELEKSGLRKSCCCCPGLEEKNKACCRLPVCWAAVACCWGESGPKKLICWKDCGGFDGKDWKRNGRSSPVAKKRKEKIRD